jgi:DNA-binding response OmpR family regulator
MPRDESKLTGTVPVLQKPASKASDSGTVPLGDDVKRKIRHDLRSPINQIIGFSEMLREDAEAQGLSNFVDDLVKIETAARRMVQLVDEFAEAHVHDTLIAPPTQPRRPFGGAAAIPLPRPEPSSGRVLAVDDDPMNREMVARRLRALGYEVETAEDGPSALSLLERSSYDLLLLDVVMPEVSGLEVLETIRGQYDRGDLPVIMTTALDQSTDVVEALRLGANDYVTKPLDMAVVIARIDTQLGLKQARDKVRELNLRLAAAQERVASLADGGAVLTAAELSRSIASEISDAMGRVDVAVWVFDEDRLDVRAETGIPQPEPQELEFLRTNGRAHREEAVLLAIAGPSGRLLGAIGVGIGSEAFGERRSIWSRTSPVTWGARSNSAKCGKNWLAPPNSVGQVANN